MRNLLKNYEIATQKLMKKKTYATISFVYVSSFQGSPECKISSRKRNFYIQLRANNKT